MTGNSTDPAPAAPAALESQLPRLHALFRQQQYAQMLRDGEALLAVAPAHRDLLLLVAVAQRYLGRVDAALRTLAALETHHAAFSRLYQERGYCQVALKRAPEAIDAFLRAVNINVALPGSWRMLESLYRMTAQADNAATAAQHVATLARLPPEVVTATGLFADGDWDAAESTIRAFLLRNGNEVEAMRLLARIGIAREVFDDADLLLEAVLELAPDYRAARQDYAGVLIARHKYGAAQRELQRLRAEEPDNRLYKTLYATACVGLGEHEQAVGWYRELLVGNAADADLHLSIAHALKTLGRTGDAIESYRAAAACRPDFGDAYWSLANLKTYRFTAAELQCMYAAEAAPATADSDRWHLRFALGKALEDSAEYAQSFRYYELGNSLKRAGSRYRAEIIELNTRLQIDVCTGEFFASRRGMGRPRTDPIFIVGLPRSGSTLLEQILASHSLVEGTQELADIQRIVLSLQDRNPNLNNPRYPRALAGMHAGDFTALADKYLADTAVYRTAAARASTTAPAAAGAQDCYARPFFIDKMPNNFRHLGLIHLMLPNATIIDARREPMACCFSNFKQLFANGQEFTYSIEDIARYYRTYLELMRHWDRALPGRILRVQHEDVVDDLEGNVRRILDHCGLDFEPACVEFHKNVRSVRTASSEQVRQPISRAGLDQWAHFAPWLGPLKDALGDALTNYRD